MIRITARSLEGHCSLYKAMIWSFGKHGFWRRFVRFVGGREHMVASCNSLVIARNFGQSPVAAPPRVRRRRDAGDVVMPR